MPTARYALSAAVRGLRAFLSLEAGVVRDGAGPRPEKGRRTRPANRDEEERLRGLLAEKERQISALRDARDDAAGVRPENIVWIFGTGRSGNTWLSSMMEDLGHAVWREPSVGRLFGEFYYLRSREGQRGTSNFILGEKQRKVWLRSIRNLVLDGANGRFPEVGGGYLTIKEQVGSVGAPLLMEALPESRMVLLVRDPRDVVASWMDADREGGWRRERLDGRTPDRSTVADKDPLAYAEEMANHYARGVGKAMEAYENHRGAKVLVRYEELRSDALTTMRRILAELGVPVDDARLARVVGEHSWERVPEEQKGEGKFHRKARPGSWREDLTPEQAATVEKVTAPLLEELYPG